jgi:hypothetical protein
MNETAVFEQRPYAVKALGYASGTALIVIGAVLTAGGILTEQPLCFLLTLATIIPGVRLLMLARSQDSHRKVTVDPAGFSFFRDGRQCIGLPWTAIRSIGTIYKMPDRDYIGLVGPTLTVPFSGYEAIFLTTDNGRYTLRCNQDFGPVDKTRELFRLLVRYAVERNIRVEDGLGWGYGSEALAGNGPAASLCPTGYLVLPANLDTTGYEGKWHHGRGEDSFVLLLCFSVAMSCVGAVCLIFGFLGYELILTGIIGLFLLFFGILFGAGAFVERSRRISAIYFNREGLFIQNGRGIMTGLRWNQVRRCRLDTGTRCLAIDSDTGNWEGPIDNGVMTSICKQFTLATGRPAEAWSSGYA